MDLLLDTHVFLWYIDGNEQLPEKIVKIINDKSNRCFVSIASIWEIVIKLSIDKLEIKGGFKTIENFLDNNDFEILPIDLDDTNQYFPFRQINYYLPSDFRKSPSSLKSSTNPIINPTETSVVIPQMASQL
jgi:PIN domain nuclease of toxin-antitoxin system